VNPLAAYWHSRPPRERSALTAGIVVVAVMLVVALVWIPLERTRQRLGAELPGLRASVASLQAQAAEVKKLRATLSSIPPDPSPLAPLMAANAWARELPGVQLAVPDEKHVRLKAEDVAFTALLDWLTNAQAAHGLRVESARIEALSAPGRVRAELTLARS
jgi:type II secretory pathway component PulM